MLADGTNANAIEQRDIATTSVQTVIFVANANVGAGTTGPFASGAVMKHASAFDLVGLTGRTIMNGGGVVPFTFTSAPSGLSRMLLGNGRNNPLGGWLRRVTYWPRVLTDAELQQVTT
jgi:hypothetical protein